jgi:putative transposase
VKKSRFSESQTQAILAEGGSGIPIVEVCRKHGISNATYYQRKRKYGGTSLPKLKRVKEMEAENARLKRMFAELALEDTAVKDVLSRKL